MSSIIQSFFGYFTPQPRGKYVIAYNQHNERVILHFPDEENDVDKFKKINERRKKLEILSLKCDKLVSFFKKRRCEKVHRELEANMVKSANHLFVEFKSIESEIKQSSISHLDLSVLNT